MLWGVVFALCWCDCQKCFEDKNPLPRELESDEVFDAWLKAHPMDPVTEESVQRAVQHLKKRLRATPGPDLNL